MTTQNPRAIIDANAELLETFVTKYLLDEGITVQLFETVTKEIFGQQGVVNGTVHEDVAKTPRELLSSAVMDILDGDGLFGVTYNLDTLIDGAASLEFLVRYARKVNPAVFPPEVIPSDEVVNAALALFHASRQQAAAE